MLWRKSISSPKSRAKRFKDLAGLITKHLKKRERVKIAELWKSASAELSCPHGPYPATGEPTQIKASKKVAFRVTKELKMAI